MEPSMLDIEIKKTKKLILDHKKFGVNLITLHTKISQMIDICIENKVEYIIFAGSVREIKKEWVDKIKRFNIKIFAFAPSLLIAKGLIKLGIDALIIEGNEAGGHVGPVSTTVLAQEILPILGSEIPIFVGGGIGHGSIIFSFLKMGAAGVQIGTHFVCSEESGAHPNFKQAFISANSRDAVVSIQIDKEFPVIPVRSIKNQASDEFLKFQKQIIDQYKQKLISKEDATLKIEKFWAGALKKAVIDGDVQNGSLMAGQSVGMISKIRPIREIIDELIKQTEDFSC
jgi:enoyl-[acyl-carrier protein] reductase II